MVVTLTAVLKAKQGQEQALENTLVELVTQVESEEGTLKYVLNRAQNYPSVFMVYEVYKDKDALAFHGSTDYFKAAMKKSAAFLEGTPVIEFYTEVARIKR